jgi:MSHA biogenesis protein MshQ
MYTTIVWKNRVYLILLCLLQRSIGWRVCCYPSYRSERYWIRKVANLTSRTVEHIGQPECAEQRSRTVANLRATEMIFILAGLLVFSGGAYAATVTTATGGGAIASNTAPSCSAAGTWYTLTGPVLTETAAANIGLGSIVLTAPSGFEFDSTANVTILLTGNSTASRNINNVATGTSMAVNSITSTAITFTVTEVSTRTNTLTWQGIKVRPTASTSASGNIVHTGTSTISGVTTNSTNFGTLTEVISSPVCNEPSATTNAATSITTSGATLNGTVSSNGANTAVTFDYGLTTSYGGSPAATATPSTVLAGTSSAVSSLLTGLTCNTTYHFRISGVSSLGTANGNDLTFTTAACPAVTSINTANSNPTNASSVSWTVTFNTSVTGVSSSNFTLVNSGLGGAPAITGVTGSGTTWTVTASTGTGNGTLGLDMANVTGISPAVTPTTFTGQVYTIDRIAPVVSSIALAGSTPTALSSVSWNVTFSKSVTGVDAADFTLVQADGVSGAAITAVTGSGTAWTVTASTGTGNGTLGLNLVDDDSIIDASSNPLGGTSAGNGDFSGEVYTVAKPSSPTVCTDDSSIGTKTWSTLTGPVTSDNAYATATVTDGETTHYLKCTGYGFAIPSNAIIEGITVGVERFANNTNLQDAAVRIVKGGAIGTTDRSNAGLYPTADPNTYDDHGGVSDLWGETWTPADINSANFGVALASRKSSTAGTNRTISVDHITISVAYKLPVNCTSNTSGNWSLSSTWTNCRGGIPLADDNVTIANAHNVTLNVDTPTLTTLTIDSGGTLTNTGSNTITLSGAMSNAGTYVGGSGAVTVGGDFTNTGSYSAGSATTTLSGNFSNSGTFTADSGTWSFSGSSAQSLSGVTSFNNLTVNNTNGVSLNNNVSVSTLLTLTNGSVSTDSNIISVSANCPGGVVRTSGFIDGNLRLTFPSGTTTCTYYVGSSTTYAPISVALTASASGTTLTGSTTGSEHPQIATAGIDATQDVNRYWSLWAAGDAATAVTSFGATFTFVAGDIDIGATTSNFIVGKYVASAWSLPTVGSRTSTTTSITGVSGPITAAIGFALGEAGVVDAPCTSPEGMTCMCDNFARSNLNPSTIYGADWFVGNVNNDTTYTGCSFSDPVIANSGYLRLTDNCSGRATVANVPGTFPAAGNLIVVEFKHYAYDGTGGDGMALTLSDSTLTPTPGAFGGSLGYAQKIGSDCATPGGCPGFNGGWIGVAIDEYGNFSANTEGRTGVATPPPTAPGRTIDSVAVRGSGSGVNGYPYLGGSGTLSSSIDSAGSTAAPGELYRITVDARCYQSNVAGCNNPSLNKIADVKVERDTTGLGTSYVTVVSSFDAFTVNPSQDDVPINWKLSFTGSTGANHNIHEIAGLKICSNSYTPPSGFSILVDNLSPTTCTTDSNGKPVITVSARDSNGNIVTNYVNTITLGAKISSPSGSNSSTVVWSMVSGSANGTLSGNQYTFAAADNGVAKFYLTDTNSEDIYIAISENGGTLSTTLSTPVQYRGTAFTVATPDTLGTGVVAGRNHLMSITRSSGCGTDMTYSGAKNLDGWYSIATGTHPAGAYAPELCATNSGGSCLPTTGSCATLSIAPPSLNASSNYLPPLTFTSGVANFCLMTTDVGNYSINLRDDSNVSLPVIGSSATLAVRPFAVVASTVRQSAIDNPATNDATGEPMVAGTAFQAMVAGYLWNSAGDIDSNGLPGASANYLAITGGGIAHSYADTVVLSASTPYAPATPLDTPAGDGVVGALTNGSIALTGGSAMLSTLSYNEVGSFTLKAMPSVNYLNAGVDLSARVAYFTKPDSNSATAWVGRFRPHHFKLTEGTATPGCGTFTYFGQDGFKTTDFELTAQNANNATTQNYEGDYAKLALTEWANFGFSVTSPPAGSVLSASATEPTGSWSKGVATVTAKHQLSRPTALTGETNVVVQAEPTDSDDVTMAAADVGPSGPLRYGRLALQNAYGSELVDLAMPMTVEYWDGNSWKQNIDDQCTTGVTLAATDPIITDGLLPAELFVWDTGTGSGNSGMGYSVAGTVANMFREPPIDPYPGNPDDDGNFNLNFRAPGAGNTGMLKITATVPNYLKFNWNGAGDEHPSAHATFGIYKGNSKFIYIRELY